MNGNTWGIEQGSARLAELVGERKETLREFWRGSIILSRILSVLKSRLEGRSGVSKVCDCRNIRGVIADGMQGLYGNYRKTCYVDMLRWVGLSMHWSWTGIDELIMAVVGFECYILQEVKELRVR
jgi:hypothetical protein